MGMWRSVLDRSATRKPKDFKVFLTSDDNKKQFCELLQNVMASSSAAFRLEKCNNAVLIVDGRAQQLKSSNGQARSFYTSLMSTIVRDFELLWRICGP